MARKEEDAFYQRLQSNIDPQAYYQQQEPMANAMGYNYGRSSEANQGDYSDIMGRYRQIYDSAGNPTGEGGGGGGGGDIPGWTSEGRYSPFEVNYSDPFESYGGYKEFSQTGGYSPTDIANMRARGISPIRSAYANAEREVGRQRSLQGGYSPNAIATQARMAREQGQAGADATQAVEAGLAQARNQGRLSGLGGMSNIEGQRLNAQLEAGMFNAGANERAQVRNVGAYEAAQERAAAAARAGAASRAASSEANTANQFRALSGMTDLYGTTPASSATFGNQLLSSVGQRGNYDVAMAGVGSRQAPQQTAAQQMQGWGQAASQVAGAAKPWIDMYNQRKRPTVSTPTYSPQTAQHGPWDT